MPEEPFHENSLKFYKLIWDSEYFGISCAKAIFHRAITIEGWAQFKSRLFEYDFVSIENRNSELRNAQLIGRETNAFLVDVNIQFCKKIAFSFPPVDSITIHEAMSEDGCITDLADFDFSRFTEDAELFKRGGANLHRQWVRNSFGVMGKFFAVSCNEDGRPNGFLLFSIDESLCTVELIAAAKSAVHQGVGTNLFKAAEYAAYIRGCDELRAGTQIRNLNAINFYHKVGCRQTGCHQVYHLWTLKSENDGINN